MGTSTDAILLYGYCWDEEGEPEGLKDWQGAYAAARGVPSPSAPFPTRVGPDGHSAPTGYSAEEQAIVDQHRAYWRAEREVADGSPVIVGDHGVDECRMTYLAIKASRTVASRGCPELVMSLDVDPTWGSQIEEFCDLLQIDVSMKKLGWWLVSWWG